MYFRTAEEESICSLCDHPITAGSLCISLAPINEQVVETVEPAEFAVLHIACESCDPGESCFVTYASWQSPTMAHEGGVCAYCQHGIDVGQPILLETILVTDEEAEESDETQEQELQAEVEEIGKGSAASRWGKRRLESARRTGSLAASQWGKRGLGVAREAGGGFTAAAKSLPSHFSGRFRDLTPKLQGKFARAGLRSWWKPRNMFEAEQFYESTVPRFVRNLGKTEEFIKGKSASHIESVQNALDKARLHTNILWEPAKANLSRGSRNMTRFELFSVKAKNAVGASRIVGRQMAGGAMRGAALAALLEAPISTAENVIFVRKGKKTRGDAAKSVAKDTAKAGAVGAAVGAGMIVVVAVGGGVVLAPIAMPIAVVGGSIYAVSSVFRIRRALGDEPSDDGGLEAACAALAFHVECAECESSELCHDAFLRSVVASAA